MSSVPPYCCIKSIFLGSSIAFYSCLYINVAPTEWKKDEKSALSVFTELSTASSPFLLTELCVGVHYRTLSSFGVEIFRFN